MVNSHVWDTIATRMSTFCSLCGVLVDPWQDDLTVHPELSWLNEVRVVRSTQMVSEPYVTGVGYLNFHQEVCAPRDTERRYDEEHQSQQGQQGQHQGGEDDDAAAEPFLQAHAHFNTSREYWCYVFHDACWELLRDRIDPDRQIPADTVGRHLFALLYNTPTNGEGTLVPGHDYGGAAQFQRPARYGYFTVVNASRLPYLTGDVREALQTDEHYLWEAVQAVSAPFQLPELELGGYDDDGGRGGDGDGAGAGSDAFCTLPNEIMMLVLEHLESVDVCRLRLASRYVADLSSPRRLSQEFWASRFRPGGEMDFVFAGPVQIARPSPETTIHPGDGGCKSGGDGAGGSSSTDWRQLYIKAKATLSDSELFPGFRNRKRVWHNLQNISDALRLRIANEAHISDTPYRDTAAVVPAGAALGRSLVADVALDGETFERLATRDLDVSCRLFEAQTMLFPCGSVTQGLKIGISYVYSNGRTYISGLQALPPVKSPDASEISQAGFINAFKQDALSFPPGCSIEALEAVVSAKGVIGLRFYVNGHQGRHTFEAGELMPDGPDSGIGRLSVNDGSTCVGFTIGLDACKIISISLIEKSDGPDTVPPRDGTPERIRHDAEIWNPKIPVDPLTWTLPDSLSLAHPQNFNLCLDMDFGGPDGRLLGQLIRVNMVMASFPAVFIGIEFVYSDGTQRAYGRRDHLLNNTLRVAGVDQTFCVDGPNGEVLTKALVSSYHDKTIQGISLFTNWDRSAEFRLHGQVDCGGPGPLDFVTVEPQPSEILTSFCAKVKSPGNYFYAFGGRSRIVREELLPRPSAIPDSGTSHNLPITPEILESAEAMLAYPRGFTFSAADLTNVRAIHVSLGAAARSASASNWYSRSERHISGLWIEYHDAKAPAILGQWIRDSEAPLVLAAGDRVTQVTTWHDYTNGYKRVKFGPIVKLRLVTAHDTVREYLSPVTGGKVCLVYRENPYEKLHSILWGCNYEWDHVRVMYAAKAGVEGNPLVVDTLRAPSSGSRNAKLLTAQKETMVGDPRNGTHSWMVLEKAFMVESSGVAAATDGERGHPEDDTTNNNNINPVVAIEVSFKDLASEPAGLTLAYADGSELTLGARGKRPQRLEVQPDETLTRMDVGLQRGNRIGYLELRTNTGRKLHFRDTQGQAQLLHEKIVCLLARDAAGEPVAGEPEKEEEEGGLKTTWLEGPRGDVRRFVGFWAMPKRRDRSLRYTSFGPLFETRSRAEPDR